MAKFEKVSRFKTIDLPLPIRKTAQSASNGNRRPPSLQTPAVSAFYPSLWRSYRGHCVAGRPSRQYYYPAKSPSSHAQNPSYRKS